jgi:hypothetical protein
LRSRPKEIIGVGGSESRLIRQKSFQQMADEKGLHVIQFTEDRDNYPVVRVNLIAKYGALDSFVTVREKQRIAAKRVALIDSKSIKADNEQHQEVN